jgi:drug/metabolite transporter (DMT)-like permease
MDLRQPVDAKAAGLMTLLCLVWAVQQVLMKASAGDVSPLLQIAIRSAVAALLVAGLLTWRGGWPGASTSTSPPGLASATGEGGATEANWHLGPGLLVGLLFAAEFAAVGLAVDHTTASRMVVFLYTSPIFAALGLAWWLPSERLKLSQWIGIALAFLGLALAFLWRDVPGSPQDAAAARATAVGDAWALLGGLMWGLTTVVVRCTSMSKATASLTLLYQLVGAALLLGALAPWMGHTVLKSTALAWSSLIFQSFIGAFASFLAWFWLLRRYLASRLGVFVFFTPLFGVMLGTLLLGERLETGFMIGALMVMLGIVLVTAGEWLLARRLR